MTVQRQRQLLLLQELENLNNEQKQTFASTNEKSLQAVDKDKELLEFIIEKSNDVADIEHEADSQTTSQDTSTEIKEEVVQEEAKKKIAASKNPLKQSTKTKAV